MKKKKQWYDITDINQFVEATRVLVYTAFANSNFDIQNMSMAFTDLTDAEQLELNGCLSTNETINIAKDFMKVKNKDKNKKSYIISDKGYIDLMDALTTRITANLLHKLSNDGVLDSAFDEELNDFVFWTKDEDTDEN